MLFSFDLFPGHFPLCLNFFLVSFYIPGFSFILVAFPQFYFCYHSCVLIFFFLPIPSPIVWPISYLQVILCHNCLRLGPFATVLMLKTHSLLERKDKMRSSTPSRDSHWQRCEKQKAISPSFWLSQFFPVLPMQHLDRPSSAAQSLWWLSWPFLSSQFCGIYRVREEVWELRFSWNTEHHMQKCPRYPRGSLSRC